MTEQVEMQPKSSGQQKVVQKRNIISSNDSDSSTESHGEPIKKKKKSYKQRFSDSWLKDEKFSRWLIRNPRQQDEPFCILCSKAITGGITHIYRHAASAMHKKKLKCAQDTPRVTMFYDKQREHKIATEVKTAELKMVAFIAEHNLALSVLDHLPKFMSSICPDSEIAKKVKLCRKRGTRICKDLMRRESLYILSKKLQESKFSLNIDETTDVATSKSLAMLARFYDKTSEKVCDKFLALLKIENASANGIFTVIYNFLKKMKFQGAI